MFRLSINSSIHLPIRLVRNMLVHDNTCDEIPDDDRYFLEDAYLRVELEIRRTCQRHGLDTSRHHDRRGLMTEQYASFDEPLEENDNGRISDHEDNTLRRRHYTTDDNALEENDFEMVIGASKQLEHDLRTYILVDEVNNDEDSNTQKAGLLEMIQEVQRRRLFSPSIIGDMFRFLKRTLTLICNVIFCPFSFGPFSSLVLALACFWNDLKWTRPSHFRSSQ